MLLGLSVYSVVCCYVENSSVCLTGSCNHVLDEVTVSRSIDDCEVIVRCVELLVCDIDGYSTCSLLLQAIHDVC